MIPRHFAIVDGVGNFRNAREIGSRAVKHAFNVANLNVTDQLKIRRAVGWSRRDNQTGCYDWSWVCDGKFFADAEFRPHKLIEARIRHQQRVPIDFALPARGRDVVLRGASGCFRDQVEIVADFGVGRIGKAAAAPIAGAIRTDFIAAAIGDDGHPIKSKLQTRAAGASNTQHIGGAGVGADVAVSR